MEVDGTPVGGVLFGSLNPGETFEFQGTAYMKTALFTSVTKSVNAVELSTGHLTFFIAEGVSVFPIKYKAVRCAD